MIASLLGNLAIGMSRGWGYDQLHTIAAQSFKRDLLTTFIGPVGETQIAGPACANGRKISVTRGTNEPLKWCGLARPEPLTKPLRWPNLEAAAEKFSHSRILKTLLKDEFKTALLCPLIMDEVALGWLWVLSRDEKPIDEEEAANWRTVAALLSVAAERERLASRVKAETRRRDTVQGEREALQTHFGVTRDAEEQEPLGKDPIWLDTIRKVNAAARSESPVLLNGETGTGKEVLARWIHFGSQRARGPFVAVNCGAFSNELSLSELFGHERGAFTGADKRRLGLVEAARGGTLFLDEVGELSAAQQVHLLRFLENGEFRRVGGNETLKANVRIISATDKDLKKSLEMDTALYYRLSVVPIEIPPLRRRREDIIPFLKHFVSLFSERMHRKVEITDETEDWCLSYHWPGNVREMRNLVERHMLFSEGGKFVMNPKVEFIRSFDANNEELVKATLLPPKPKTKVPETPAYPDNFDQAVRQHIMNVLKKSGGRIYGWQGAADRLGIKPSTLQGKMKKLGMQRGEIFKTS